MPLTSSAPKAERAPSAWRRVLNRCRLRLRRVLSKFRARRTGLEADYAAAWNEWVDSGAEAEWDVTTGDGLTDAPR